MIVASFFAPRYEVYDNCDYDALALLLDKSCKKLGLEHVVISDSFRPKPLKTCLTKLPENLMQAIFYGQIKFMKETNDTILFTGADCLLTKKLGLNHDSLPDLAITTSKTFSDCEMNTGAVWVKDKEKCIKIWEEVLEKEPKDWGDDQIFLYEGIKRSNLNTLYLPCEEHNWAPSSINDDAGFPTVVHFRGKRKSFMKDWAKRYLGIE